MAVPAFRFLAGKLIFLFLGEIRPFCILGQNDPANKARNRPCSISHAEKFTHWPKFFATFRQYTDPGRSQRVATPKRKHPALKGRVLINEKTLWTAGWAPIKPGSGLIG